MNKKTYPIAGVVALATMLAFGLAGCDKVFNSGDTDESLLAVRGVVAFSERVKSNLSFSIIRSDLQFVFKPRNEHEAEEVLAALTDSTDKDQNVVVRFAVEQGYIDRSAGMPVYLVREVEYAGHVTAGERDYYWRAPVKQASLEALARGVAYYEAGKYSQARAVLSKNADFADLNDNLRQLAFRTRGWATVDEVDEKEAPANDADDQLLVQALTDMKAWATLDPDSSKAQQAIALTLRDLGAFDEALTAFAEIAHRWPDQKYQSAVNIGSTYRMMGYFENALRALDDLVAAEGPQSGMKFHYHRGWTLLELHRHEEAVLEFSAGLENQQDYAWAFIKRACAYAQLGRNQDALNDQQQGLKILREHATASDGPRARQEIARAEAIVQELQLAVSAGKETPISSPCTGYGGDNNETRTRSRWLPKAP